jgi:hypothetical protein
MLGSILVFGMGGISIAAKESRHSDQYEDHESGENAYRPKATFEQDAVYIEECGACHLAYPPGLLPAESWRDTMMGLADHFGENSELDAETATHIGEYLDRNALRKGKRSNMSKMLRNMPEPPPARITELPYFVHEHDEIPRRMLKDNPEVRSISQCGSCHRDAERGVFDEDRIIIPGFGRWDG